MVGHLTRLMFVAQQELNSRVVFTLWFSERFLSCPHGNKRTPAYFMQSLFLCNLHKQQVKSHKCLAVYVFLTFLTISRLID